MKQTITFLICVLFLAHCATQKKAEYELPEQMLPQVKVEYLKMCDRGQVLYNLNCAKCHTSRIHGKNIIPDFKPEQLKGYELRHINSRHENNLNDTTVTAEELGIIMTFLTYKKKNK
jgi:mono/diheme cytochrome c family protein